MMQGRELRAIIVGFVVFVAIMVPLSLYGLFVLAMATTKFIYQMF